MNNNPIGVFDSGVGGLSVWRELYWSLPEESLLYYGDGLRCPYGNKPMETIRKYADEAVRWLLEHGAKMIVVACNTATAAAISFLREKYPQIPFIGMEPAVKPAAMTTKTGVVAILATEASFKGELYKRTSEKYGAGITVVPVAGHGFVELVEQDQEESLQAFETVRKVIEPLIKSGVDKIVLGCTHYPFLTPHIKQVIEGRDIEIIDPGPAVARRAVQLLSEYGIPAEVGHKPVYLFYTLADDDYLKMLVAKSEQAKKMPF